MYVVIKPINLSTKTENYAACRDHNNCTDEAQISNVNHVGPNLAVLDCEVELGFRLGCRE